MRLTQYTDYSLRVLIYLATKKEDKLTNIKDIATSYGISKNHLMKITYELGKLGIIETVRGRNGGMRLAKRPEDINIGTFIRLVEEDFHIVECFNDEKNVCVISQACRLRGVLGEAMMAYFNVLEKYTLRDLVHNQDELTMLLR
ncbi:RrF2 family transcriptional regulator [Aureibacillus halotolerans]|uniref:HTH-type transcriptional regulator NsrR n=1 Tax=Aureibacillus halotolerans TaxID=1508390 RepID=A0A4R6TVP4_9BACI|nr:Rrf2 family transcriptional regulator [Aureibacillus halotolerans]TDQ36752.1 BadM/Rrf2 family transcriptional regulator [Aureibacillus halotolerans]